jgi:hypothetical protein
MNRADHCLDCGQTHPRFRDARPALDWVRAQQALWHAELRAGYVNGAGEVIATDAACTAGRERIEPRGAAVDCVLNRVDQLLGVDRTTS